MDRACTIDADRVFGPIVDACLDTFDFTLFFEQSVLSLIAPCILILLSPLRILRLANASVKVSQSFVLWFKVTGYILYILLHFSLLALWLSKGSNASNSSTVASQAVSILSALIILPLAWLEHLRTVRPSSLLIVFLLLSIVLDLAQARTLFLREVDLSIAIIFTSIIGLRCVMLQAECLSKRPLLKEAYQELPPESVSSLINRSFFWWLNSLFVAGYRSILHPQDLFGLDEDLRSSGLSGRFRKHWHARGRPEHRGTLPLVVVKSLVRPLFAVVLPRVCLIGFTYAQPFLIQRLILYLEQPQDELTTDDGYGLIAATVLIYMGIALSNMHYKHRLFRSITMTRGILVSFIFSQTIEKQTGSSNESAALSLMSTDVDRICAGMESLHETWARLLEVIIGVYLLAIQVQWACVMPLVAVAISSLGSAQVTKRIGSRQKIWTAAVQHRISATSSALSQMKSLKMIGLERLIMTNIQHERTEEIRLQKNYRWMVVWLNICGSIPITWAPILTFVAYTIQGAVQGTNSLTTSQAFTSLAIITLVSNPASLLLNAVPAAAASLGCFERIQAYALRPDWVDPRASGSREPSNYLAASADGNNMGIELVPIPETRKDIVRFEGVSVSHPSAKFLLQQLDFKLSQQSTNIIIGPVASGKSTLAKLILGNIECDSGKVSVRTKDIAYCSQTPWIPRGTVKDVIMSPGSRPDSTKVLGDDSWYQDVIHACALDIDLKQFPLGDMTMLESSGQLLSGGQRQRVALARALYSRRPLTILDDVVSALDSKTADLVMDRLFGVDGIFGRFNTCVVFLSHSGQYIPFFDHAFEIDRHGQLIKAATFSTPGSIMPAEKPTARSAQTIQPQSKPAKVQHGEPPKKETRKDETSLADLRKSSDLSIYRYWIRSMQYSACIFFIVCVILNVFTLTFPQLLLDWWANASGSQVSIYMGTTVMLGVVNTLSMGSAVWSILVWIAPKSAALLHYRLLTTTVRARWSFYSGLDIGNLLNRFAQDMTLIEAILPAAALMTATNLVQTFAQGAFIATGSSYMAITIPFLVLAIFVLQKLYLKTSRQLRLLDLEARSPVYSHFWDTINGLTTIRAFGMGTKAASLNIERLDESQQPYYLLFCVQRWLNLVLDCMVAVLATVVVVLAVLLRNTTSAGLLGVALNNTLRFNQTLSLLITFWTQLETSLGAISRLKNFESTVPLEEAYDAGELPSSDWPQHGSIEFQQVSACFKNSGTGLRDISMSITAGQRIGVCGRTGSGKSSLLATILRFLDLDKGRILIDGHDINSLPSSLLRERLIVVSQDTVSLSGSIRYEVDPLGTQEDTDIVEALNAVGLWQVISLSGGLDVETKSLSLSSGQLQLLALARAILRRDRRIVILDEATSSVDSELEGLMQGVIEKYFNQHTIINVAHRLSNIVNYDRIAVLADGELVEFDTPGNLLSRDSIFAQMYQSR